MRPSDERLLAFLEGEMGEDERTRLLDALDTDALLARDLRSAARGWAAMQAIAPVAPARARGGRRIPAWWAAAAAVATLLIAVPSTLWMARGGGTAPGPAAGATLAAGELPEPETAFVLVLHGRWPDAGSVDEDERRRRAVEYWSWAADLQDATLLEAAGDLRWEPGRRLGPNGMAVPVSADVVESPDFVVGMFALDVGSYEEAVAIARDCPHLRYGGSVSVRQVARRFFTTPRAGAG